MPDSTDLETIHTQIENNRSETVQILEEMTFIESSIAPSDTLSAHKPPWRLELRLQKANIRLVFDFHDKVILGRTQPRETTPSVINFSPYQAREHGMSRHHAQLILKNNNIVLQDLGSMNGTALNTKRLQPNKDYIVRSGDLIHLGLLDMRIYFLYNPFIK